MKSNLAKKQITMVTLVLALALAVYLNWRFASNDSALTITETLAGDAVVDTEGEKYYGEALFVSAEDSNPDEYFAQARLNRSRSRDEALETLQKTLQQTDLTQAEKEEITKSVTAVAADITKESNIESLIKAKGFEDSVVYISGDKVKVVVKANASGLSVSEVSQIKEIVLSECDIPPQNITIVEIK